MITVPEVVEEIIRNSPFLEEALAQNIINLSSLARRIKPEIEEKTMKDVQEGSIIMALKRLIPKLHEQQIQPKVYKSVPHLIVRSNLFEITVANSHSLIKTQRQILEYASSQQTLFATITHGVFETTIIASEEVKEHIQQFYAKEKIISELHNLSSITIKYPQEIIDTPGVYYAVLKALAWENIPFTEVVSTYSEATIILKHEYVDRAFTLIKNLFTHN